MFLQGEEAIPFFDAELVNGFKAAAHWLAETYGELEDRLDPGEETPSWGAADEVASIPGYTDLWVSYNIRLGYVGLCRKLN